MVSVVACLAGALVLLGSVVLKFAGGAASRDALATYGLRGENAARAWAALVAVEAGLAVGVAVGSSGAAIATAGLFAVFAVAQATALSRGRGGRPCGCFGARGRLSGASLARTIVLAAGFAVLPLLPRSEPTTDGWLAIGLGAALLGLGALTVVVLSLAREVGVLRLSLAPQGALEIPHEGPELRGHTALAAAFGSALEERGLGLAVFTSEGCSMCRALAPTVASLSRDPHVALRTFDEVEDAEAWAAADVPGSPYAVAIGADGTVLAKGTFNNAAQLESVLATAERRRREALHD
jgi:methylamine utilization protein MauE